MTDFPVTIWHNPDCGTSRTALAAIREAGLEPEVVEYLKTGWTADGLKGLLAEINVGPRDILHARGTPAEALGLLRADVSDEALIAAMIQHPLLVNRPIVRSPKGVRLTRPAETVRDLLP